MLAPVFAGLILASPTLFASGFADAVLSYEPGNGFSKEFGSGLGYTNNMAVLGEPSRVTSGQFGGPVDPFSPPYLRDQLLSIGAGGSVTLRLENPAFDLPSNPYGIDFIIFGSSGFVITNGDFTGGGVTDGTLFGANSGATRVSVSPDNTRYFILDPSMAPPVDGFAPTDGSGDFHLPINPSLYGESFAGLDIAGIRALYAGSGGGAGYDIAWARDENGQPVSLEKARYVRIEVLDGAAEIDGISALPGGRTLEETFDTDPRGKGWSSAGDSSLFTWDSQSRNLKVIWDSGKPNSFFYWPFQTVLGKGDDFSFGFEIAMDKIAVGLRPDRPYTFQLALGLLNLSEATDSGFRRGSGNQSPNLVEFDYFPDSGFGATISPVIVSSKNRFVPGFSYPLELTLGDVFRVSMSFSSASQTLVTKMWRNGDPFGPVKDVTLPSTFGEFRVDAFAISSFSDTGGDGSILAEGVVDNVWVNFPHPPVQGVSGTLLGGEWQVEFRSRSNWMYVLEETRNFLDWNPVGAAIAGTNGILRLTDPAQPGTMMFYRVRAEPR